MKILLLFVTILLFARENPFIPVVTNNNKIIKREFFTKTKIQLPSDARIIKEVIIKYQSLNGSIKEYKIPINKAIDWHNPLYLSTKEQTSSITKINIKFLTFYIKNHKLVIQTKDKMIRNFFLVSPFRFVIDFQANKNFLTISKTTNTFIKKIVLGNHSGFYRVVLYLDGSYKTFIQKTEEGYLIEFK